MFRDQILCFALALWNGRDPFLKERLFGLTNAQGNHGEDVKELYYYLDATPTHSYNRMLYKYPQAPFPYQQLADEARRRTRHAIAATSAASPNQVSAYTKWLLRNRTTVSPPRGHPLLGSLASMK